MRNTKKGFTLVELLVVIAILAILATVSVVGYTQYITNANQTVVEDALTKASTEALNQDILGEDGNQDGLIDHKEADAALKEVFGTDYANKATTLGLTIEYDDNDNLVSVTYTKGKAAAKWTIATNKVAKVNADDVVTPSPAPAHECESECATCGGCTDSACEETACATKCECEIYVKVTSADQFTNGTYILVVTDKDNSAQVLGLYDNKWILPANTTISNDVVNNPTEGTWTITVNGSQATLKDANGTFIAPKGSTSNEVTTGEYEWTWTFSDGAFVFAATDNTNYLAYNGVSGNLKFRAYKAGTVTGDTENYKHQFTLYKLAD